LGPEEEFKYYLEAEFEDGGKAHFVVRSMADELVCIEYNDKFYDSRDEEFISYLKHFSAGETRAEAEGASKTTFSETFDAAKYVASFGSFVWLHIRDADGNTAADYVQNEAYALEFAEIIEKYSWDAAAELRYPDVNANRAVEFMRGDGAVLRFEEADGVLSIFTLPDSGYGEVLSCSADIMDEVMDFAKEAQAALTPIQRLPISDSLEFLLSFSAAESINIFDRSSANYEGNSSSFSEIVGAYTWSCVEEMGFPATDPDRVVELTREGGLTLRFEESGGELLVLCAISPRQVLCFDCGENIMDEIMAYAYAAKNGNVPAQLEVFFYETLIGDEFTMHLSDMAVSLTVKQYYSEQEPEEIIWSCSDESVLHIETYENGQKCLVSAVGISTEGVTLTVKCGELQKTMTVYCIE